MANFSDLIIKDELTERDRKDLQRIASEIERTIYDLADTIGTTGATFQQRATFQRALSVYVTGFSATDLSRGILLINSKAAGHHGFMGVRDDSTGHLELGIDDDLAAANTSVNISILKDPADPDNVGQYDFGIFGGGTGAAKVSMGGEVEIWAGSYAATQGKITAFNLLKKDIDFQVSGDTVTDVLKVDAGLESVSVGGFFNLKFISELTIASGEITVTGSFHSVDTQNDDATDNLDTINGGQVEGNIIMLKSANDGRDTTITESGNCLVSGSAALITTADTWMARWDAGRSKWCEIVDSTA